jgi:energy-coupling factor transport system substrate-specific component
MAVYTVWYIPLDKMTVREVALFGILGSLTFVAKYVMSGLPNIEPVSLMVMLFTVTFGKKAVYPIGVYVAMEFLFYGFGIWNIMYLYIWFILAAFAWMMRKMEQPVVWAMLSGSFGLMFGLFCAPVDLVMGGAEFAVSKWISGIPFDLLHCAGNFVMALLLFAPLGKLMKRLNK